MVEEHIKKRMQLIAKYIVNYCRPLIRPFDHNSPFFKAFSGCELAVLADLEIVGILTHRQVRDIIQARVKEFKKG